MTPAGRFHPQLARPRRQTMPRPKFVGTDYRRIRYGWTAWLIGGGNPIRVMNVYALQNIACWYVLAGLLLRWFPAVSWGNWFRWTAVLFSFGYIFSVRCALLDGPALLLVAAAMALAETNRPWWGALVMGIAGLGKDTRVLEAAFEDGPRGLQRPSWTPARWPTPSCRSPSPLWQLRLPLPGRPRTSSEPDGEEQLCSGASGAGTKGPGHRKATEAAPFKFRVGWAGLQARVCRRARPVCFSQL